MCHLHFLCFLIIAGLLLAIVIVLVFVLRHYFRLSQTDELTSLPNFRGFRRKLKKALKRNNNTSTGLSVVLLDIDGFKRFNNHSYALGDKVLQDFVESPLGELPADVFLARYRLGDEFILIFPCNSTEATDKMNTIARLSNNLIYNKSQEQMQYTLTFSFGVATYYRGKDSIETLLEKAEKALKENKKLKQNP